MKKTMRKYSMLLAMIVCSVSMLLAGCECKHEWKQATCTQPSTCSKCGKTSGDALGHDWIPATCSTLETCARCGETRGDYAEHNWMPSTSTTPAICRNCGEMIPMAEPSSGEMLIGVQPDYYNSSSLTIKNSSSTASFIKMKDANKNDVFAFYVPAGENVTVDVPCGYFYVYFASGNTWYGPEYCFGDETDYSKDDELLDFNSYTYSYTLYPVTNGNFSETPIDADEFQ